MQQVSAAQKLIFSIDIVRHGDRTPIISSPEMDKIWPAGEGQLTPTGMHQEYQLGGKLRQKYINQYHLLPKNYDFNTMSVRSSGISRTMMSAQSILLGLYPLGTGPSLNTMTKALPEGFQPIPINIVPIEQDTLLVPNHNKQRFTQLLETYILNSPEWIHKDASLQSYYAEWSKAVGSPVQHLFDLIRVSDRLMIERLYDIPPPEGLSIRDVNNIINAGTWAWLKIVNHPKLALAGGYELAQTIEHELNLAKTQPARALKYLLFVAHDSTIAAQLQLLDQMVNEIPSYASQLNFSLYELNSSSYEVRVSFNQKPLYLKCGGYSCTLEAFIQMMDQRLEKLD